MKNLDKILKSITESCKESKIKFDDAYWKVESRPTGKMAEFYFVYKGKRYGGAMFYEEISQLNIREEFIIRMVESLRKIIQG